MTDPCTAPTTAIACENSKVGNPTSQWEIDTDGDGVGEGASDGDPNLQGFATDISVNRGDTVHFKVKTTYSSYRLDIYRLGYYQGGAGARLVATVNPSAIPAQPACLRDQTTKLVDCGNWTESASWAVPSTSTSGVYIAKLVGALPKAQSHIIFVVRDDAGSSDLLFQTSDTTWQAYNSYNGLAFDDGASLYTGATKVSYNRPFNTRGQHGVAYSTASWFFTYEYPMIRWLEANGYDVSYTTGVDSDRSGARILNHRAFLSVGHDEYWSAAQRTNVESARAAGVHLAFFSGNEMFWKTRWESSAFGPGAAGAGTPTPYRTLVSYKESNNDIFGTRTDPTPAWTGTWRDPTFSPPSDGGRPANALTGTNYQVQLDYRAMKLTAADAKMRFWRHTDRYLSSNPQPLTAGCNCLLGHEWDEDSDNGLRPPGVIRASTTATPTADYTGTSTNPTFCLFSHGEFDDAGYRPHAATHHLTLYRTPATFRGALVFGAGTIAWSWALDAQHDRVSLTSPTNDPNSQLPFSTPELAIKQATVNLFADMCDTAGQHCVQPRTIQSGLFAEVASADSSRPTSAVTSPASNASIVIGTVTSITGTATDNAGAVGGVEVSVDGGVTWHPAQGHDTWTYTWTPTSLGATTIRTRAVDDSGNLQNAITSIPVNVVSRSNQIVLFYNQSTGSRAVGKLTSAGDFVQLNTGTLLTGWTHVVTGTNNILFLYNSATGDAQTAKLDDAGNFTILKYPLPFGCDLSATPVRINARCPGWTHIVAGSNNLLLFYNSFGGNALIGRLDADGEFVNLGAKQLAANWTNIVAGVNNVFFFYDRNTGNAATAKLGVPAGTYTVLKQVTGVLPGWTHIVAGVNNVLLFFKSTPGNAMSAKLDDVGNLTVLNPQLFAADLAWTSIVGGMKNNVFLFYHSPTGTGATGSLDVNGNYVHLFTHNGFSTGWTQLVGP